MAEPIVIHRDERVFVLTGAGISAESGLPTFRASDGLWAGHAIEDVCTPGAWERNEELVWQFYSARRGAAERALPNPAHMALAELEEAIGDRFFLCTQNVDDLHEKAGSRRLVHMHGDLFTSRCSQACGRPPVEDRALYTNRASIAKCQCGALMRPHIVWFGEVPLEMDRITEELGRADVMVVVGTSGSVYPAASFVRQAGRAGARQAGERQAGARTMYVGPEAPLNAAAFSEVIEGEAGRVLPGLFVVD